MGYVWFIGIIVFAILEAVTFQFVSIWFAGGALGALIAYLLGAGLTVQIWVFALVSAVLLVLSRPLVKKMRRRKEPTNADRLIGQKALLTEEVNNDLCTGKLSINDVVWSVKSEDGQPIEKGTMVTIKEIRGVKLIVAK